MKRISVLLSEDTLSDIDSLLIETRKHRSELIREACCFYIEEKRRAHLRERMKIGYQEMAELNRILAEELASDFDCVPDDASGNATGDRDTELVFWRKA